MLQKDLEFKNVLLSIGYIVIPDRLVKGAWIWYSSKGGSELPLDTMQCAVKSAWEHASQHTKSIIQVSDDRWKAMPDDKKISLVQQHMSLN